MKLHLGCGDKHIPGFINVDIQESPQVDVLADVMELPYEDNSVDVIYECSMLEHFGRNNNLNFFRKTCWTDVVKHWFRILKPGGELYVSVPDFEAVCIEYLKNKNINDILGITLGGQKNEEDLHGMLFDFNIISTELKSLGFSSVDKYDWRKFQPFVDSDYDDLSKAYLPHMDIENGRHMMLNVRGIK